jgi:hypothetical protein
MSSKPGLKQKHVLEKDKVRCYTSDRKKEKKSKGTEKADKTWKIEK